MSEIIFKSQPFFFFKEKRKHQAEAVTMTSDLCVGEGREQKDFPAEINEGSYHYNKASVRLKLYKMLYLIHVNNKTQVLSETLYIKIFIIISALLSAGLYFS